MRCTANNFRLSHPFKRGISTVAIHTASISLLVPLQQIKATMTETRSS